jgi:predicted GNAT family acetyltransferase
MIIQDPSAQKFLDEAAPLLYEEEAVNALMLGLCELMVQSKEQLKAQTALLRIVEHGKTVSAAIQTNLPLQNLILSFSNKAQLQELASYLKTHDLKFQGVVGPTQESEIFSDLWTAITGKQKNLGMGQKIYKADRIIPPQNILGELKIASEHELDITTQWLVDFAKESLPPNEQKSFEEMKLITSKKMKAQWIYLWVVNGNPVSVAHLGRPTKNSIAVSGVFTPQHLRKKGYASAVTAGVTQAMLDAGKKFCVLYTDLANPTSNKIYQVLGYREVADSKYFLFK